MTIANFFIPTRENRFKPFLLRKIAIVLYTLCLLFVNSFGGIFGIQEAQASSITSANIISLTNQERVAWGLNTLETNSQLSAAALAKANDMFEKQYWDHFGPNGESPWQFIHASGYSYVYAGENLAKGFRTAEGVHEAWMASPTHKANIVSNNYKDIGVAVVEGVLLGKQTVLVVQMFGNLTNEVFGAAQTPVADSSSESDVITSEKKVVVNNESGEIKSIRITSPQEGTTLTDPSSLVKGDTSNVSGSYVVEIYDQGALIGDTTSESSEWEFKKQGDWEEGEHNLKAGLKNSSIYSSTVNFHVDSKAPMVDPKTIEILREGGVYKISFVIEGEWESISLVLGTDIKEIEHPKDSSSVVIELLSEEIGDSVILIIADQYGNTSELDISQYFVEEDPIEKIIFPVMNLSLGDQISIGIVSFVFLLLIVEVIIFVRRGRMKDAIDDIFTIGAWWLILAIGAFSGFTGVVN